MSVDTLGDRIEKARVLKGLNQTQLSRRLSIKAETLKNWENDRSAPRANKLNMLAGVLGVTLMWLLTGDGEENNEEHHGLNTETLQAKLERAKGAAQHLNDILYDLEGDIARLQRRIDEENTTIN